MSVVVSLNLSDGVILGVDSAITLPGPVPVEGQPLPPNVMHGGVLKVYENADKLFPLGDKPIGIAAYGTAVINNRTVGNCLHEFAAQNPNGVIKGQAPLKSIAEELHKFFDRLYRQFVIPAAENYQGKPFDQIPETSRPGFGFVIGGFSHDAHLSEVWLVFIPGSGPQLVRGQGDLSANWYALYEPIDRYLKGYSSGLVADFMKYLIEIRGPFSEGEQARIAEILTSHEFVIPTSAMPIAVGEEYVRFLVELVINHHRYAIGGPVVGGRARIGKVTYSSGKFEVSA